MPVHVHKLTGLRFEISELPKPHYEKDDYCVVYFSNSEAKFLKDNPDFEMHWKKKLTDYKYSPLVGDGSGHQEFREFFEKLKGAK